MADSWIGELSVLSRKNSFVSVCHYQYSNCTFYYASVDPYHMEMQFFPVIFFLFWYVDGSVLVFFYIILIRHLQETKHRVKYVITSS